MDQKKIDDIFRNIRFGVDYYPEHWPRERWEQDANLMQKNGNTGRTYGGVLMA